MAKEKEKIPNHGPDMHLDHSMSSIEYAHRRRDCICETKFKVVKYKLKPTYSLEYLQRGRGGVNSISGGGRGRPICSPTLCIH